MNPKTIEAGLSLEGFLRYLADCSGDIGLIFIGGTIVTVLFAHWAARVL